MPTQPPFIQNDGSSQAGRKLKALDPTYVAVDERSTKDLLAFAQKYAHELRYFNENNQPDGDWSAFLGDYDLDELARYLANPEAWQGDPLEKNRFTRPHLALFLTFLELLQLARAQLNDLTRRHLEFYYREALRLTSRDGLPDRAHTIIELSDRQEQYLLPAGSLFEAGEDAAGQPLFYRSDEDILVNRATLGSVKSLFTEKQLIRYAEARQAPNLLIEVYPENETTLGEGKPADRSFIAMLMMALGSPLPGNKLEPYPGSRTVNAQLLGELDTLLAFAATVLYMPFSTFRSLMALKSEQANTGPKWNLVNNTLEAAARARLNDPAFVLDRSEPANFEKNLLAMLGRSAFGDLFNELPEVDDIYGVYRRRDREDVIEFIQKSLFMSVAAFSAMMEIVEEINGRWRQVYEILRAAGRKKQVAHPEHPMQAPQIRAYVADKFNDLVSRTLGSIDYSSIQGARPNSFDEYLARIIELENYFQTPAEKFVTLREINAGQENTRPWEWEQAYAILDEAHEAKAIARRRDALKTKREKSGFDAMILHALGDPNPGDPLPDSRKFNSLNATQDKNYLVEELFLEPANYTYIRSVQSKARTASVDEWNNVYTILEAADRRKRKWSNPPAEIEKWENLYVAPDASQIQVRLDAESEDVTPRWRAFGKGFSPQEAETTSTQPGSLGFAIASPILALSEGKRNITLTVNFREETFDATALQLAIQNTTPFSVLLSTEKGMLPIETFTLQLIGATSISGSKTQRALQFLISLDEQFPPIIPPQPPATPSAWPVLQIMLADLPQTERVNSGPQKRYFDFRHLLLEKIRLNVEVDGLLKLSLQNENGALDPKRPFEPFGMSPLPGSSLYLAHPELCSKQLEQMSFTIEWMGAPDNFSAHYLGYLKSEERETDPTNNFSTSPVTDNTSFVARLKLYDNRSSFEVGDIPLFNANPAKKNEGASQPARVGLAANAISAAYPNYRRELQTQPANGDVLDWSRYWLLELGNLDFQHRAYPRAAAGCANKITPGTSADPKARPYIVNQPYTPKIKRLTVGYTSSLEIDLSTGDLSQQADRLYHVEPFGSRDLADSPEKPYSFLPRYDNEGELFIGIKDLTPPQSLSLLFQMAEGSADPSLSREPIHWHYLDGDVWRSLEEGRLLTDSTNGLVNSGIIRFNLAPVKESSLLPADEYWLRASIARNSRSVADIVAIHAQAVRVTFEDRGNDPQRLAQPLPAGSITGLAEPIPQVKAVHQPYTSFGGKSPEKAESFYTRASERLRHKNRTLTGWDYERMVLEAFPGIYKVKCLPVGTSEDPRLANTIQVVVIPDIQGKLPFDPFEPKLPADMLWQIEQYLGQHSPPFARIHVTNPSYVRLKTRLGVRLRPQENQGYYKNLLNEELQRYLAPWAYDRSQEIVFGGRINASLIVNFLEERPYVDYVAGIKLFTSRDGQHFTLYESEGTAQFGEVTTLAADAILVSDRTHEIDLITEEGYEQEFFTGINYMKVELDFQVATG